MIYRTATQTKLAPPATRRRLLGAWWRGTLDKLHDRRAIGRGWWWRRNIAIGMVD